jgi:pyruvate dehydrogenase E1 component
LGTTLIPLGVDDFGQSGTGADLYRHFRIGWEAIVAAALTALDGQ